MSVASAEARAAQSAPVARARWLASPYAFWVVLALYLAAHVALRLWETPNIGKNDVQEALAAQGWAWGYHPRNPPLHTWLLMASYSVFGVGLFAHVVLKYLLLGATYAFAYLCGRKLFSTNTLAALSALSLTLLTPFAWTVHTALTHTLLLAAIIFATLWAAIRLTEQRRWRDHALFGVVIGLGFLAKYSYPLFLGPLLAVMLWQPDLRRALISPRMVATLAAAAAVLAPHGLWMATARFDFVDFLVEKQQSVSARPYAADVFSGVLNVGVGALSFLGAFALTAPLLLGRARPSAAKASSPWARALPMLPCLSLGLLVLDVFVLRATQFEERYFMCALLLSPLALFVWLDQRDRAGLETRLTRFGVIIAAVAIIGFAGVGGRALFYNRTCDRCWDEMAVPELVQHIRAESAFRGGTIVADHYSVAGNMRAAFPHARVFAANYVVEHPLGKAAGQCMIVWNARNAGDAAPPALLAYLAHQHVLLPQGGPTYVSAPLRRSAGRMDRFAYWVLETADGNCMPR